MLKHIVKRLLHSLTGHRPHGQYHYSSSAYKKGHQYPPRQPHYPPQQPPHYPPQGHKHYGHSHYKKKYSSYSS
ncbi:hypothetical protein ACFO9Q_04040 [Paenibacillus sp. GCM10023252]|uniref:hypothetical protein n=1 Tax=Paenibacillus sp. GCM10023252 TaxID=3252649 RepID=UPI003615A209